MLLLIKKHYFIHCCCLFLKSSKPFSVSLSSNPNLFADNTSLFLVVHNLNQSGINLNDDLEKKQLGFPTENEFQP